jgi:hypothetical protein
MGYAKMEACRTDCCLPCFSGLKAKTESSRPASFGDHHDIIYLKSLPKSHYSPPGTTHALLHSHLPGFEVKNKRAER